MGHVGVQDPLNDSSTDIDEIAAHFSARLTQACAVHRKAMEAEVARNQRTFAVWDSGNRVDNPDPLRFNSKLGPTVVPGRTFLYGLPPLELSGATVQSMPRVAFMVSPSKTSSFRTPAEQAKEVVAKKSHVCWGAHMSDKARHILPNVDGRAITDGDEFERILGPNLSWFKSLWVSELRLNGLLDAGGGATWFRSPKLHDQLHVEIPNAKVDQTDQRAKACVDEYARLRKVEGKPANRHFEDALKPVLKAVLNASLAKYQ